MGVLSYWSGRYIIVPVTVSRDWCIAPRPVGVAAPWTSAGQGNGSTGAGLPAVEVARSFPGE
ncbi:MAG TPA: hypothetical protein PKV78_07230 [Methanoculleus thermophilus]|nr:hypothetical protein [Methanoculleus thermophilus]